MTDQPLPRVAVVYADGSVGPGTVLADAEGLCEVIFVCDAAKPGVAPLLRGLRRRSTVCDITGLSPDEAAAAVRREAPEAIVTFSEYCLGLTAELAERLGLPYHGSETTRLLTDKLAQRAALAAAGVDATGCRLADSPEQVLEAAAELGYPIVVKPRTGAGSRNTVRLDSAEQAVRELPAVMSGDIGRDRVFVVEECLVGDPSAAGEGWGDYVSVEGLVYRGEVLASCVSGKLPLAEPFRETGFFLPSTLSPALAEEVRTLAAAAVRALGIRDSVTHTEVKLTPAGPRIIEVNGRVGGHVVDLLPRASKDSLVRFALDLALGRRPADPSFDFSGVTFEWVLLPPVEARELTGLDGVDEVRALDGITAVDVLARPGQPVDWRIGNQMLGLVHGHAPDHTGMRNLVDQVARTFVATYRNAV
ncbi:acetyl-CoA carboxylase biotin carboxylase subunit family protein [Streptomyces sp. NPDC059352]|uniref:ATP-grasp domain-containing protein n=1 Tax=Streptomyces sp. NPDC059352 TaxID=3346810 RepID=UPI00368EACAC